MAVVGLLVPMVACSAKDSPDPSGVSDDMVRQSIQFRQNDGLFLMPEVKNAAREIDYRYTAAYASVLERSIVYVLDHDRLAHVAPPTSTDLVGVDAYLQVREMAAATPLDPDTLSGLVDAATLPERRPDLGSEVGALYAWASTRTRLLAAGGRVEIPPEVTSRVAALDVGGLRGHPYLVMRTVGIYSHLKMAEPENLKVAAVRLPEVELPPLTSVTHVLDAAAIIAARQDPTLSKDFLQQIRAVMALGDQVEDVSRAHLIAILDDTGHRQEAGRYLAELHDRVDPHTGLLRAVNVERGTVRDTYLFSRLLDSRFSEVATDSTVTRLRAAATDGTSPLLDRLQAVAALRRAGAEEWSLLAKTVVDEVPPIKPTVTRDELDRYMAIEQPLLQLDPEADKSMLEPFLPGDDEVDQKRAAAAMRDSYLFSNGDSVGSMFPEFQKTMRVWLDEASTPFPKLVAAGGALPASRIITVSSKEFEQTSGRIEAKRGCPSASTFFSADGSPDMPCSLVLTIQSRYASQSGK